MGTRATVGRLERRRHGQRGKHCGRRLRKRESRRQREIRVNKQDSDVDEGGEEGGSTEEDKSEVGSVGDDDIN